MMTKQDYAIIAARIYARIENVQEILADGHIEPARAAEFIKTHKFLAYDLEETFARNNPKFDREKFRAACIPLTEGATHHA